MPSTFQFPDPGLELWGTLEGNLERSRTGRFLQVVGRRQPEVTTAQAQADMESVVRRLEKEYPDTNTGWDVLVVPLHDAVTENARATLLILFGAVGLVLLIVCFWEWAWASAERSHWHVTSNHYCFKLSPPIPSRLRAWSFCWHGSLSPSAISLHDERRESNR